MAVQQLQHERSLEKKSGTRTSISKTKLNKPCFTQSNSKISVQQSRPLILQIEEPRLKLRSCFLKYKKPLNESFVRLRRRFDSSRLQSQPFCIACAVLWCARCWLSHHAHARRKSSVCGSSKRTAPPGPSSVPLASDPAAAHRGPPSPSKCWPITPRLAPSSSGWASSF